MSDDRQNPVLTEKFEEALGYATRLHAGQFRKQSRVPYIAHLLGVAALVLEDGGSENEAIAALLHDAVEDQGGLRTLEEIRRRFGNAVAAIVEGCSDSYTTPKPPWKERKSGFIESIRMAGEATRRVALADKVYNARATLRDVQREGESAWRKFNGGKDGTLWYYRKLIDAFEDFKTTTMLEELKITVAELERIAGRATQT